MEQGQFQCRGRFALIDNLFADSNAEERFSFGFDNSNRRRCYCGFGKPPLRWKTSPRALESLHIRASAWPVKIEEFRSGYEIFGAQI